MEESLGQRGVAALLLGGALVAGAAPRAAARVAWRLPSVREKRGRHA